MGALALQGLPALALARVATFCQAHVMRLGNLRVLGYNLPIADSSNVSQSRDGAAQVPALPGQIQELAGLQDGPAKGDTKSSVRGGRTAQSGGR